MEDEDSHNTSKVHGRLTRSAGRRPPYEWVRATTSYPTALGKYDFGGYISEARASRVKLALVQESHGALQLLRIRPGDIEIVEHGGRAGRDRAALASDR